jgi:hypothetical protein
VRTPEEAGFTERITGSEEDRAMNARGLFDLRDARHPVFGAGEEDEYRQSPDVWWAHVHARIDALEASKEND